MRVGRRVLVWGLLFLALSALAPPASAQQRSFRKLSQEDTVTLAEDGSFTVRSARTFDFRGTFTGMTFTWLYGDFRISSAAVAEGGVTYRRAAAGEVLEPSTYRFSTNEEGYKLEWEFRAFNERRTFALIYTVERRVFRYDDVAELYWTFVGDEDPLPRALARITFPPRSRSMQWQAWGHPRRADLTTGVAPPDRAEFVLAIDSLGLREAFEFRIAFDPATVPRAPRRPGMRRPQIIREERARAAASLSSGRDSAGISTWGRATPYVAGLAFAVMLVLLVPIRRRRPPGGDAADSGLAQTDVAAPPSPFPPAIGAIAVAGGRTSQHALPATVLDLARRGFISLSASPRGGFNIRLADADWSSCAPFERLVLVMLREVGEGGVVDDDALRAWAARRTSGLDERLRAFERTLSEEAMRRGVAEPHRVPVAAANGVVALVSLVVALAALSGGGGLGSALIATGAIAFGIVTFRRPLPERIAPFMPLLALLVVAGSVLTEPAALGDSKHVELTLVIAAAHLAAAPLLRRRAFAVAADAPAWRRYAARLERATDPSRALCDAAAVGTLERVAGSIDASGRTADALPTFGLDPGDGAISTVWFVTGLRVAFESAQSARPPVGSDA